MPLTILSHNLLRGEASVNVIQGVLRNSIFHSSEQLRVKELFIIDQSRYGTILKITLSYVVSVDVFKRLLRRDLFMRFLNN